MDRNKKLRNELKKALGRIFKKAIERTKKVIERTKKKLWDELKKLRNKLKSYETN